MVVKGTSLFAITKYVGPHICVNPCMNRDYCQLDSKLVANHIKSMIKVQFTLSVVAVQASIMEKFGYEISYKKPFLGKQKVITNLFGDLYKSCKTAPLFYALNQENYGRVAQGKH